MLKRDGSKEGVFLDIPHVMGIVNVTPDSFSDGGCFLNKDKAIEYIHSYINVNGAFYYFTCFINFWNRSDRCVKLR